VFQRLRNIVRHVPAVLGLCLLVGAIYVVQREFRHFRLEDITHALAGIPHLALALSALLTVCAYIVLSFYDRMGTIFAGHPVSYGRVAFASFCAYTLSHNLGFAAVSGAAVRYRLYAIWGLGPRQIAKVVAFCSLTFGLGAMVLAASVLISDPLAVPFFGDRLPTWLMYVAGGAMVGVVIGYVSLASIVGCVKLFGLTIELPGWKLAFVQVALATLDVAVTASIVYVLLPPAAGLTWFRFVGIYLASYSAGLVATLPGGLGVFDGAMLLGLSPYLDAPHILGAIVVYRLYYYVVPLFVAGVLFTGNELLLRGGPLLRRLGGLTAVQALSRWNEPDFAVGVATGIVAMCGALLLSIAAIRPPAQFSWVDPGLSDVAAQASEFIPSLIGAALMVLSVSLSQRVTLAWWATITLLAVAAIYTASQGFGGWIPTVLVLAVLLLAPLRGSFYRHARLLVGPLDDATLLPLLTLIGCVMALGVFTRRMHWMRANPWWEIVVSRSTPNGLRIALALIVALGLIAIWRLMRPGRVTWSAWKPENRLTFGRPGPVDQVAPEGIVWGESDRAAIPFRRVGPVLLGLGDPVGADSDRVSAIWRLRDLARQEGLDPAVWRAGPQFLNVYADLGLAALPLGLDGLPRADDTEPPRSAPARDTEYLVCVAERDLTALLPLLPELALSRAMPRAG
jgi:phosphatidylglycerol lysyltransferase